MKPIIIAVIGASCAGKDTLMRQLYWELSCGDMIDRFPDVYYVVSSTTRPPRKGERNNEDYHFLTDAEFQYNIDEGHMLEWTEFRGWKYGTDKKSICLKDGAINIGVFNLQGIRSLLLHDDFTLIPIYLDVNWRERLKRSINREDHLTLEMIRRLVTDFKDFRDVDNVLAAAPNSLYYKGDYDIEDVLEDILGKIK